MIRAANAAPAIIKGVFNCAKLGNAGKPSKNESLDQAAELPDAVLTDYT